MAKIVRNVMKKPSKNQIKQLYICIITIHRRKEMVFKMVTSRIHFIEQIHCQPWSSSISTVEK